MNLRALKEIVWFSLSFFGLFMVACAVLVAAVNLVDHGLPPGGARLDALCALRGGSK